MRGRYPVLAIVVSLCVHAALFAALFALPSLFARKDFPGPGDEVEVWLTEPTGSIGTEYRHGVPVPPKRAIARQPRTASPPAGARPTDAMALREAQEAKDQGRNAEPETEQEQSPDPGGSGGLGGPGVGRGRGGDPLLAKIWSKINASKYYPAAARRAGLMGSPRVRFLIAPDGSIVWVRLAASCGKKILDDAALETVRRAAPLPFYPKPITVAVTYSLMN